jgi:hypothetical protein
VAPVVIPALLDLDNPIKDLCNFFVIYLLGRPVVQEHTTVKKKITALILPLVETAIISLK